jgi:multidrug efflux pump subunit AcrA (membrane-fusion protein)
MKNTTVCALLCASLSFVGGLACRPLAEEEEESVQNVTVTVQTAAVMEGDAIIIVTAYGRTDALRKENVYAPLAGKITTLKAFEGTEVEKGDILAVIETKESQAAILGAETMLQSATTPEDRAQAERALELAKGSRHAVSVPASFHGLVASRSVSEGELVPEGAPLVSIVDLSTVNFLADVLLRDIPSVSPGQSVTINFEALGDQEFPAVVDAISPQTDAGSQTVQVRLRFARMPDRLRSLLRTEMLGTARIRTGIRSHALFIPKEALLRNDENNTHSVVIITSDSLALHVPVSVGVEVDSLVEVQSPTLQAGMAVITVGAYSLADSTRVIVGPLKAE